MNYDDVDNFRGLDIIICTSARNNDDGLALLKKFNFPFRNIVKDEESNKKEEVKYLSDDDEKHNSDNISESSKE